MTAPLLSLACVGALIATLSRGTLLAFAGALAIAAVALLSRHGLRGWSFAAAFTILGLSWFGLDRIETRMRRAVADAPGRTIIWKDTLERMGGRWMGGTGFNTFGLAMYRSSATKCNWLVPLLKVMFIKPPPECPYSAGSVVVRTLTS